MDKHFNLAYDLFSDIKFAVRSLSRSRIFSVFAILTLALGIGATTTVFTLVNTLLLHPLPAHDPSTLASSYATDLKTQKQSGSLLPISYPNLKDYEARTSAFSGFTSYSSPMGFSPADPLSLLGASLALVLVAAVACSLPAIQQAASIPSGRCGRDNLQSGHPKHRLPSAKSH
ncbi:MAG TPA: hypothetical protein VN753_09885 [Terracidiphilus sp.]|jgi:hypothetical protein|nr:hypothetical protein [Terracidiphilus sp.]